MFIDLWDLMIHTHVVIVCNSVHVRFYLLLFFFCLYLFIWRRRAILGISLESPQVNASSLRGEVWALKQRSSLCHASTETNLLGS